MKLELNNPQQIPNFTQGFCFPPPGGLIFLQKLPFHVIVLIDGGKVGAGVLSLAYCFGVCDALP